MTASKSSVLKLGAVAYAPKVITIWEGFRAYFAERGAPFDYVLYSNYEALTEALMRGDVDLAWNSPLALCAQIGGRAAGLKVEPIAMRDTDIYVQSLLVVMANSPAKSVADLRGKTVGFGAIDSPQATLIPLDHMRQAGLVGGRDFTVRRFDAWRQTRRPHRRRTRSRQGHGGGRDSMTWMVAKNYKLFASEGLAACRRHAFDTSGAFDHCNMTSGPHIDAALCAKFREVLMGMSWTTPTCAHCSSSKDSRSGKTAARVATICWSAQSPTRSSTTTQATSPSPATTTEPENPSTPNTAPRTSSIWQIWASTRVPICW